MKHKRFIGYVQAFIAFAIFSFIGVILNTSRLTPSQTIFSFSLLAVFWLVLHLFWAGRIGEITRIKLTPIFLSFVGMSGIYGVMFLVSQTIIPLSQAQFLFSTVPIFALLIERFVYRHPLKRAHIIAILLGILGVVILLWSGEQIETTFVLSIGSAMAVAAAFLAAMQGFFLKKLEKKYSLEIMIITILSAQALVSALFAFQTPWSIDTYSVLGVLGLSVVNGIIAFYCYTSAIHRLRVSTVRILGYVEPLLGTMWGFLFLSQQIYPATLVGGVCVLLAAYCVIQAGE